MGPSHGIACDGLSHAIAHDGAFAAGKIFAGDGQPWYDARVGRPPSFQLPGFADYSSSPGSSECNIPPSSSQVWPCFWLSVLESGWRRAIPLNSIPRRKQGQTCDDDGGIL